MASVRLNNEHRGFLRRLARETISVTSENAIRESAYNAAVKAVCAIVQDRYPPKDMRLLKKYSCAAQDDCIRLQLSAGGVVRFQFDKLRVDVPGQAWPDETTSKDAPLVPIGGGCSGRMFACDEAQTLIVQRFLDADEALGKAWRRKIADYEALIEHSRTLEEVETVWPRASDIRPRIARTLPVVLSADVIDRIRADVTASVEA